MELKIADQYKQAIKLSKTITIIAICVGLLSPVASYLLYIHALNNLRDEVVLVSDEGLTVLGNRKTITKEDRKKQYFAFVKQYYNLLYTYDQNNFEEREKKVLDLSGSWGQTLHMQNRKNNVLANLRRLNLYYTSNIEDDQLQIKIEKDGAIGIINNATRTAFIGDNKKTMQMQIKFKLNDISISYDNPYGVIVEKWNVVNEKTIKEN